MKKMNWGTECYLAQWLKRMHGSGTSVGSNPYADEETQISWEVSRFRKHLENPNFAGLTPPPKITSVKKPNDKPKR